MRRLPLISAAAITLLLITIVIIALANANGGPDSSSGPYRHGYQLAYQYAAQQASEFGTGGNAAGQAADITCEQQMVYGYAGGALKDADAGCRQGANDFASQHP